MRQSVREINRKHALRCRCLSSLEFEYEPPFVPYPASIRTSVSPKSISMESPCPTSMKWTVSCSWVGEGLGVGVGVGSEVTQLVRAIKRQIGMARAVNLFICSGGNT